MPDPSPREIHLREQVDALRRDTNAAELAGFIAAYLQDLQGQGMGLDEALLLAAQMQEMFFHAMREDRRRGDPSDRSG